MLSKSKSHYIPILLFLVSGLLGVSSYSTELSTKTEVNRSLSRDRKTISNIASERLLNSEKLSNNQVDEIDIYPIKNPNLLKISGPDVTLVFKKTEAKKIFEYLADIANYGFVYVKNNATNESDEADKKYRAAQNAIQNIKRKRTGLEQQEHIQKRVKDLIYRLKK